MSAIANRTASAAGTLAAIGLGVPVVALVVIPALPIAIAAMAFYAWRADAQGA